ncbi:arabinogalactan peptide [Salix suchowensis]|nr:arabinogalactan peptide [Salix suchowensis]
MAASNISSGVFAAIVAMIGAIFMPLAHGQSSAPAPSPTNDGTTIDQGVACILMLLALVLTYLIH